MTKKNFDIIDRSTPILIHKGHDFTNAKKYFCGQANPDEYYAFQIAISGEGISGEVSLQYGELSNSSSVISAENFFCINLGGTDYLGNSFEKNLFLEDGDFLVLWVSLYIPDTASGNYCGKLLLSVGESSYPLSLSIIVSGGIVSNHGDNEPWRFSRLRWLNTYDTKGLDKPVGKYTALQYNNNVFSILGRKVELNSNGLPKKIYSYYNKNIKVCDKETKICDTINLVITAKDNLPLTFKEYKTRIISQNTAKIVIETTAENNVLSYRCTLTAEFDGYMGFELELNAKSNIELQDISLVIPYTAQCSTYFMGLGHTGGLRPETVNFKWDMAKRQNGFWMGGVNGGLRCEFRGENYYPPLPLLYYRHRTLTVFVTAAEVVFL